MAMGRSDPPGCVGGGDRRVVRHTPATTSPVTTSTAAGRLRCRGGCTRTRPRAGRPGLAGVVAARYSLVGPDDRLSSRSTPTASCGDEVEPADVLHPVSEPGPYGGCRSANSPAMRDGEASVARWKDNRPFCVEWFAPEASPIGLIGLPRSGIPCRSERPCISLREAVGYEHQFEGSAPSSVRPSVFRGRPQCAMGCRSSVMPSGATRRCSMPRCSPRNRPPSL